MDIRNFFGKSGKPPKKKVKPSEESSSLTNDNTSTNRTSPRRRASAASRSQQASASSSSSSRTTKGKVRTKSKKTKNDDEATTKTSKRKPIQIDDDDDSTTDDEGQNFQEMKKRKTPSPRKKGAAITSTKKQKQEEPKEKLTPQKKERVEISTEEFFADTKQSSNSSKKKRSVTKIELDETNDNDDGDYEPPKNDGKSDADDRDNDEDFLGKTTTSKKKSTTPPRKKATETSTPVTRKAKASPRKKKTPSPKPTKETPLQPTLELSNFDTDDAAPECLQGRTFVFTGVLEEFGREEAQDFVKILGGRTTTAVSGKTDYLVAGELLEDGRPYIEGSKYKKATSLGVTVVLGKKALFGLAKLYSDKATPPSELNSNKKKEKGNQLEEPSPSPAATPGSKAPANPYAKMPTNPYAKRAAAAGAVSNPYAKRQKPTGTAAATNPYAKQQQKSAVVTPNTPVKSNNPNALWADKYAPQTTRDILGNQESVRKLGTWLDKWESIFNGPKAPKSLGAPNGPKKAALLSGPPGIGKTTTATLIGKESGRDVLEWNASDVRSKKGLEQGLGDVTGSQVLNFGSAASSKRKTTASKKRVVIMDEVDGMGAGDRSGMSELIKLIKTSKVPIICICNDRQSQKVRSLVAYCLDLRFKRPVKTVIARRALRIGQEEGMRIEQNAAEAIAESCGNDIRQVLNCLQMWKSKGKSNLSLTYKDIKERQHEVKKDDILRVSMFDATKMIVQGRAGLSGADPKAEKDSLYKRSDAYFVDYSLMGLMVQQNYLKVMVNQYQTSKRSGDSEIPDFLDRMYDATSSMSDFAVAEQAVRGGDQNWGLLPTCSMLAVKTGYHAGGENGGFLPAFPEFAGWMGKNSTRGKKNRILQEISHHMNYKVSGDSRELRLSYLPILRDRFLSLMTDKDGPKTTEVIELMDKYGLDRDDVFENLDEFKFSQDGKSFASLDSKQKAAFTREYNKGVHKSQALVSEQGVTKSKKSKASAAGDKDLTDPDAIDDDGAAGKESDEEIDDEADAEKIRAMFKKKGNAKKKVPAKKRGGKKK